MLERADFECMENIRGRVDSVVKDPATAAALKPWYLAMLLSHVVLAIAVVPLALISIHRGLNERFDAHRRIARWTWPVWMYVSLTGVAVYLAPCVKQSSTDAGKVFIAHLPVVQPKVIRST